jgi:oxygen-independent coproporphyrinogen-3 oxidase
MENTSVYIHIPFCRHRCSYCDFNTYAGMEKHIPGYVDALCREIQAVAGAAPARAAVHTVFFGGGTPSLLPLEAFQKIFAGLNDAFTILPNCEISIEANPGTVSPDSLAGLRGLGVNRISFGMQSAHPDDLRLLERQHDTSDVINAVKWARQAGFDNLNLDLMFGVPFQTLERWQRTIETALGLQPEHLSLYALTLEESTPFYRWTDRGLIPTADDDLAAEMYEWAGERLAQAGFAQYEISNWARQCADGRLMACRHNLQYWRDLPYFGFGAGAHGYVQGVRYANAPGIHSYVELCNGGKSQPFPAGSAAVTRQPIERAEEMQEMMMVGLRLTREGVSDSVFKERFGLSLAEVFGQDITYLVQVGLLEWAGAEKDCLRLTPHGRLLGNQVFQRFISIDS